MSDLPPPPPAPPPGWGGNGPGPPPPPPPPPPAPGAGNGGRLRPVGEFLSACFTAVGRAALPLVPILAVCAAPLVLLFVAADASLGFSEYLEEVVEADTDPETGDLVLPDWDVDTTSLVVFAVAIGVTFGVVAFVVTITGISAMSRAHRGEASTAGDLVATLAGSVGPVLGLAASVLLLAVGAMSVLALVAAVAGPLGVLLGLGLVPLGVYLYGRLGLALAVSVLERRGVSALGRSWELTRGRFWAVFGRLLLFSLVLGLASQLVGVPLQFASVLGSVVVAVSTVLLTLVQVAFAAFGSAGAVVLYLDLADRPEPPAAGGPWSPPTGPPVRPG